MVSTVLGLCFLTYALASIHPKHLKPVTFLRVHHDDQRKDHQKFWKGMHQPYPDEVTLEFHAFDQIYQYDLEVKPVFAPGTEVTVHGEDGLVYKRAARVNTYAARTETGWVSATLHEEGTVKIVILDEESGNIHVERLAVHEQNEHMDHHTLAALKSSAVHGVVAYREEHIDNGNQTCGARQPPWKDPQEGVSLTPTAHASRELQSLPEKWTNCFTPAQTTRMYVGTATDVGFYKLMGSSVSAVEDEVASVVASSNMVYYYQVDIYLTVDDIVVKTTSDGTNWNQDNTVGCYDINTYLTDFSGWRNDNYPSSGSTWMALTNCYSSGTVGLAWVGTLCNAYYGTGVSGYTGSSFWVVYAHELGHNAAADHSFEEGQGSTGGIMDYGDGTLDGIYQFNSQYRQTQVCEEFHNAINGISGGMGASNCFAPFADVCGDGVISGDETCDTGAGDTACCVDCQLVSGAECGSGDCCSESCTFLASDTACDDGAGYCNYGVCAGDSVCSPWGFTACGTDPNNPCTLFCDTGGGYCEDVSIRWTSGGVPLNSDLPEGTHCSTDPTSECQSNVCTALETYSYSWYSGSWSSCSVECGTGTQTRTVYCQIDGTTTAVSDDYCSGSKPATSQSCDTGVVCPDYSWVTGSWGTCSVTCGPNGVRTRTVTCTDATTGYVDTTGASCLDSMPATSEACNENVDCEWYTSTWGSCSMECGGGSQTRTVLCEQSAGVYVDDSYCDSSKPATSQDCNTEACPSHYWGTTPWSSCSVECGGGTQTREYACYTDSTLNDDSSLCQEDAPVVSQACNEQACPMYAWNTSAWGACVGACGGEETRVVDCIDAAVNAIVIDSYCSQLVKPTSARYCEVEEACNIYRWEVGSFGECSASCGGGSHSRDVRCVNEWNDLFEIVDDEMCDPSTKPSSDRLCNMQACGMRDCGSEACTHYWYSFSWSQCSTTCGSGEMTRDVVCRAVGTDTTAVDGALCAGTKPSNVSECNVFNCPRYVPREWSECDAECGDGQQTRTVDCVDYNLNVVDASQCSDQSAPSSVRPCQADMPCPLWRHEEWGDCSAPCGTGTRSRDLSCRLPPTQPYSSLMMDESDCPSEMPAASEDCNTEGCPAFYYSYSAWTACDVECGGGVQERTVSCVDISGNAADGSCFGDVPLSSQDCNTQACPVYEWIYADTEWGDCDADCGDGGNQTRDVACVAVTPGDAIEWENVIEIVSDEMCVPEDVLPTRQSCNVGAACQENGLCHNNVCSCFHGYETFEDGTCGSGPRIFDIDHIDSAYPWGIPYDEPLTTRWQSEGDVEYVDFMMQLSTENLPKYLATNIRSDTGNQGQFAWDHVSRVQDHTHRMFVYFSGDVQDSTDDWGMSDVCAYLNCEHGYCMDGISAGAVCVCDDNWSGTHCNTDACQELGCHLEGTDVCDSEDGCMCLDGFSGETCSTPDSCTLECTNGGHADADCASCNCPRGSFWSSDDCSTCGLTCSNDGVPNAECTACDCQPGWGGEYCDCQHFTISFFVDDVDINMADDNEIVLFSNLLAHDIAKVIPGWSADQVIIDSVVASGSGVDATVHLRTTCQSVGAAARNLLDATLEQAYADLLEAVSSLYFQERSYIATNIDASTWSAVDEVTGDELAAPELATSYVTEDDVDETGGNVGAIIGAVIGSLVGVALIGVCVWKRDELGECCSRNTGAKKDIHLQNIGSQHMSTNTGPKAPSRHIPPANDPSKWETHLDDASGHYYYYNTVTEVTTWDKPHCL